MGLLFDQGYWRNVANEMWALRPMRTEPMPAEDAVEILVICCKALTDLVKDSNFDSDLEKIAEIVSENENPELGFDAYLEEFGRAEVAIAMQAGVEPEPALAMGGFARHMVGLLSQEEARGFDPEQFRELVGLSQHHACEGAKSQKHALDPISDQPVWSRCWRAAKGLTIVTTNVGVPTGLAIIEPFSAAGIGWLVGRSTKAGEKMLKEAWKGAY